MHGARPTGPPAPLTLHSWTRAARPAAPTYPRGPSRKWRCKGWRWGPLLAGTCALYQAPCVHTNAQQCQRRTCPDPHTTHSSQCNCCLALTRASPPCCATPQAVCSGIHRPRRRAARLPQHWSARRQGCGYPAVRLGRRGNSHQHHPLATSDGLVSGKRHLALGGCGGAGCQSNCWP